MPAGSIGTIALTTDTDLVAASGDDGRLGAEIGTAGTAVAPTIIADSEDADRMCMECRVTAASSRSFYNLNFGRVRQYQAEQFAGRISDFTELYWEGELWWQWEQPFNLTFTRRWNFLKFGTSTASCLTLMVYYNGTNNTISTNDLTSDVEADGTFVIPDDQSYFKIRVYIRNEDTGGTGSVKFAVNTNKAGGYPEASWSDWVEQTSIADDLTLNRWEIWSQTNAYGTGTPIEPATRCFNAGWVATRGIDPDSSDEVWTEPYLEDMPESEIWALIERDRWNKCGFADASQDTIAVRVCMDPGEGVQSWTEIWAHVKYGTNSGSLTSTSSKVQLDATSDRINAGHVGYIQVSGLDPGTTYYFEPVLTDDETTPGNTLESDIEMSCTTMRATGVRGVHRIASFSCAKSFGPHLPTSAVYLAKETAPSFMLWLDDFGYQDDSQYFSGDEGGPAATVDTHHRILKAFLEDPAKKPLFQSKALFMQYGDHLAANNWDATWWHTAAEMTGGTGATNMDTGAGYPSSYTRKTLITDAMKWYKEQWINGFINIDGDAPAQYNSVVFPAWRSWKSGLCHFIMLDTRAYKGYVNDTNTFLNDDQQAWFDVEIADTDCPLKVILSPSPVPDFMATADNWNGFTTERNLLLASINSNLPSGHECMFIYGDRHIPWIGRILKNEAQSGSAPLVPSCVVEICSCPTQSAFFGGYTYAAHIGQDFLDWCLFGDEGASPYTDQPAPDTNHVRCYSIIRIDENTGTITVDFYNAATGEPLDDGAGVPGSVSVVSTALLGQQGSGGDSIGTHGSSSSGTFVFASLQSVLEIGGNHWANPFNARTSNDSYATSPIDPVNAGSTANLRCTGITEELQVGEQYTHIPLDIPPSAVIDNFAILIEGSETEGANISHYSKVQLRYQGKSIGDSIDENRELAAIDTVTSFGGSNPTSQWGVEITPEMINDPTFGVDVVVTSDSFLAAPRIDAVTVFLSYSSVPSAPISLTATATGTSTIDLDWTDVSNDEQGFDIERSGTGAGGPFAVIQGVPANTIEHTDTGLDPATQYCYRVRAFNSAGYSDYSNVACATTDGVGGDPPAAPTNLVATAVSTSRINVTWTDNADNEEWFELERESPSGGGMALHEILPPDTTSYADLGLPPGTQFCYRVRAVNSNGASNYSNTDCATTFTDPPTDPTDGDALVIPLWLEMGIPQSKIRKRITRTG